MVEKPGRMPDLVLGPLPVSVINETIGTELEAGELVLTAGAQAHAARRRPQENAMCLPHLGQVVRSPLYVGDDHRNPDKIELVGRVFAVGSLILIAVSIVKDDDGRYHVVSFYPISDQKAQRRREKGFLKVARAP